MKERIYKVKRYIIEEYEVLAISREDAIKACYEKVDPSNVIVIKETVKKVK